MSRLLDCDFKETVRQTARKEQALRYDKMQQKNKTIFIMEHLRVNCASARTRSTLASAISLTRIEWSALYEVICHCIMSFFLPFNLFTAFFSLFFKLHLLPLLDGAHKYTTASIVPKLFADAIGSLPFCLSYHLRPKSNTKRNETNYNGVKRTTKQNQSGK